MDFETTRQLVLEILRKKYLDQGSNLQFGGMMHDVYNSALEKRILQKSDTIYMGGATPLPDKNVEYILDLMNLLLQQGIIRWGLNKSNLDPPFMSVTDYGRKVLEMDEVTPYDPDGYLDNIKSKITLDEITELYLNECIQTFQRGNYLSSAVMLGVAAESIFNQVYDHFIDSLESKKIKDEFEKLRGSAHTKRRIDLVTDTIKITAKKDFPKEIVDNFDSKTNPILNLIRRLRNDVGHPSGITIERMEMFTNMMLFKVYCEESYQIIEFLKNNKIMKNHS